MKFYTLACRAWLFAFCLASKLWAVEPPKTAEPLPDGSQAAEKFMAQLQVPKGLKLQLFAAEPQLGNPVAIALDEKNRVFVAEQYRFNRGTEENRTRSFLLEDDLQASTPADRLAMYRKWAEKFDGGMEWFSRYSDQVRLVQDRDGDGRADHSTVFAAGFNDPLDGLAAGVLAREGNVYFTCIPNLWQLRDSDNDGVADSRKALLTGFGVNAAFLGHDLHGLTFGPDGKLYFSVGDRGFHVQTEGQTHSGPRTGAVFRCNADGSKFEVVHRGLRNPQELAFDQYGNLFADDNNCDKGDHARLVYVVEGGETGWNMAYQTIPEPYLTGPWHAERLWHLAHPGQAAYLVPPVGKIGTGPSGFVYYPGVGLPEGYNNHFFMCNYTGNGGIESFTVKPVGAGFETTNYHDFLKPLRTTDVDFGYDGKMYVADYINLVWDGGSLGGRIYTLHDPERIAQPAIVQMKKLFAQGFDKCEPAELLQLLAHPDQRVRQRAQFRLAELGAASIPALLQRLENKDHLLARLHSLWALGQLAETNPAAKESFTHWMNDDEIEIRAHACRLLGDYDVQGSGLKLIEKLKDASPRVQFFAAQSLGKLRYRPAVGPLFDLLAANKDQDPFLRHAAVYALTLIDDRPAVQARATDASPSVRLAVLLVQRRHGDAQVAQFLNDAELSLVTEAARAINDLPLEPGRPALAALLPRFSTAVGEEYEPLLRRIVNAHFRLGENANAQALASLAANSKASEKMRLEALQALGDWEKPSPRDRVNGFWRPLAERSVEAARLALEAQLTPLLASSRGALATEAARLVNRLGIKADDELFASWVKDSQRDLGSRIAALQLLGERKYAPLPELLTTSLDDKVPALRAEARHLLALQNASTALPLLSAVLSNADAETLERQRALATLAALKSAEADGLLQTWLESLPAHQLPAELALDAAEAVEARQQPALTKALKQSQPQHAADDPLARFRPSLLGGDAERGRALFVGHAKAQCIRCHKIRNEGGDAGPDLTQSFSRNKLNREYMLESLIDPNAKIAVGFGNVTLALTDGRIVAGLLKSETPTELTLVTPEQKTLVIKVDDIDDRSPIKSPMPAMDRVFTLRELRDLLAYLYTLE